MKLILTGPCLLLAILLLPGIAGAQAVSNTNKNTKNKGGMMSTIESNKKTVRRVYEEALNKRNLDLLQELVADDFPGLKDKKGAAGFAEPVAPLIKAFPDIQWHIEQLIGEGDKVLVWWKWEGKHAAPFTGIEATGKTVVNEGVAVFELKDGKITKGKVQTDRLGFLQQLGVLPLDLTPLYNKKSS